VKPELVNRSSRIQQPAAMPAERYCGHGWPWHDDRTEPKAEFPQAFFTAAVLAAMQTFISEGIS
jgi:hypothetical protein